MTAAAFALSKEARRMGFRLALPAHTETLAGRLAALGVPVLSAKSVEGYERWEAFATEHPKLALRFGRRAAPYAEWRSVPFATWYDSWGEPVPPEIHDRAEKIQRGISDATLKVRYLYDDPFLKVELGVASATAGFWLPKTGLIV